MYISAMLMLTVYGTLAEIGLMALVIYSISNAFKEKIKSDLIAKSATRVVERGKNETREEYLESFKGGFEEL